MTVFHFFNCAILTFGPHAVYYSATPLSDYDTIGSSVKAAAVYLETALVKLIRLATFLKVSENDGFDPYQVGLLRILFCTGWCLFGLEPEDWNLHGNTYIEALKQMQIWY